MVFNFVARAVHSPRAATCPTRVCTCTGSAKFVQDFFTTRLFVSNYRWPNGLSLVGHTRDGTKKYDSSPAQLGSVPTDLDS